MAQNGLSIIKKMENTRHVWFHWNTHTSTGVDFTKNYSPVVTDITLGVILLTWLIKSGTNKL